VKLNRVGVALTAAVSCVIGAATLTPAPGTTVTSNLFCILCGEFAALDIAANVVMFLPFGFALMLATGRRRLSILICILVTVIIEALQVRVVTGRDASLSDIVANSLGGALGVQIAMYRSLLVRPTGRTAARLAVAWCAVIVLVLGLTAAGLRPATVATSLWVQWTPPRTNFEPFTGQVLDFDIDGINLPLGYPARSVGLDSVLRGRRWTATAKIATRGLVPRRSVITRIADERTVVVSLEQLGRNLGCLQKTKSADFRFRSPKFALRDAFASNANEIEYLTCARAGGLLIAGVEQRRDTLRLSPSLGWLLLSPFDVAFTPALSGVSALWLVALVFPAGYWLGWSSVGAAGRWRATLLGALGGAAIIGLAVAPAVAGTSVASWWEWLSAGIGAAAGVLIAPRIA
jgi:VanZ like protein